MGPIETKIHHKLSENFAIELLDIENESHKHSAPLGHESHFKILLVSTDFEGQSRIDRQRRIHALLQAEIAKIHALSLKLFTPQEWRELRNRDILLSPRCRGQS